MIAPRFDNEDTGPSAESELRAARNYPNAQPLGQDIILLAVEKVQTVKAQLAESAS